ncbi:MAG: hypothetical protein CME62_15540 [Halobacteriovoraceae bacterium]|nr:hypothetical protein [Halobacteriovoraceae bacterium]|tara:strand:- start:12149 stop:13531 length:1383 start_codon:yes stop_codon:yes gene_type:complete
MKKPQLNRRNALKSIAAGMLAAAHPKALAARGDNPSLSSNGLNVLFMTADDIGWKDLSVDGNTNIKTPHLDQLASEGIRFENAFGVTSSCSSSRASFITGQYISTHGVDGLTHRYLRKQLSPWRMTMPDYFKRAGYHTAIQGKWHVAPFFPTSFYGYLDSLGSSMPWKRHIKNPKQIQKYFKAAGINKRPFYLELNFTDTHRSANGTFSQDPKFVIDPEEIEVPAWMGLPNWKEIRADLARYYGKLLRTDYLVGETLAALKANGLEKNTIVIFVSDNGSPFPGNKMALLDRGIGTPLLMKLPGQIDAGQVSKAFVSTIDIMPTVLDLCEVEARKEIEGRSFKNILKDSKADKHRDYICAEMNFHVQSIPMRAIRTSQWKAIYNMSDSPLGLDDLHGVDWAMKLCEREDQPWLRARPPFELYDISQDPYEKINLAGQKSFASVEEEFKQQLQKNWQKTKLG